MYAIIEDSGTQIMVRPGDVIEIDPRTDGSEPSGNLVFDRVLTLSDEGGSGGTVGTPYIKGASVAGGDRRRDQGQESSSRSCTSDARACGGRSVIASSTWPSASVTSPLAESADRQAKHQTQDRPRIDRGRFSFWSSSSEDCRGRGDRMFQTRPSIWRTASTDSGSPVLELRRTASQVASRSTISSGDRLRSPDRARRTWLWIDSANSLMKIVGTRRGGRFVFDHFAVRARPINAPIEALHSSAGPEERRDSGVSSAVHRRPRSKRRVHRGTSPSRRVRVAAGYGCRRGRTAVASTNDGSPNQTERRSKASKSRPVSEVSAARPGASTEAALGVSKDSAAAMNRRPCGRSRKQGTGDGRTADAMSSADSSTEAGRGAIERRGRWDRFASAIMAESTSVGMILDGVRDQGGIGLDAREHFGSRDGRHRRSACRLIVVESPPSAMISSPGVPERPSIRGSWLSPTQIATRSVADPSSRGC